MPRNTENEPYAPMAMMGPSSPSGGTLFESIPAQMGDSIEAVESIDRTQLDRSEKQRLIHLEAQIQRGLATFYEVGNALVEIRESRLYRRTHDTFEDYTRDKWGMTRQHANRMISAAQVIEDLAPSGSNLPTSEALARPLARLSPEDRQKAWGLAQKWAGVGRITADIVEQAAQEICPKPVARSTEAQNTEQSSLLEQKATEDAPVSTTSPQEEVAEEKNIDGDAARQDQGESDADTDTEEEEQSSDENETPNQSSDEETAPAPQPAKAQDAAQSAPTSSPSKPASAPKSTGSSGSSSSASTAQSTPSTNASKAPDGFTATFVPTDDCFFLQDGGYSMQEIFSTMRALVEMGTPLGLSADDLLTTLRSTLGLDEDEQETSE